ncbi:hypothetical protein CLV33_10730 [Jejuia pallidilutea]|uniref:Uncharacterized protein n=1 Tax=Jejuia pallidilutea TaxID=504487 RepID=A0A362WZA9_9FLAO|nr:hypothetical protein [Jejuia pallidilutea]PQV47248.1 hypothetical protein CLV33_10730 [Jejuia pallidilutea]
MLKKILLLFYLLFNLSFNAQEKDNLVFKNGIERPSILSTHHFGIFSARINQNFKISPPKSSTFSLNYTSGNTFHPYVEAYFPKNPEVRARLSEIKWHDRPFNFINQETTPADYINIVIDAVIKEFRANYNFAISNQHEFGLTIRTYLITKGKHPFSLFTSDETIEWFHTNIAGGEDPFGRRYYGLNQVNFSYQDRNGRTLQLNANDFFVGGLEFNHFYYPSFLKDEEKHIHVNFGNHIGINTSKFNTSIDYGISLNSVKSLTLKNKNEFNFGVGASVLYKNFINLKNNNIDLGNNSLLASLEGHIEFTKYTKKGNYNAFGINYHIQSRFNKKAEEGYYKLLGKWREINGGWQNGVATLYKALSNWSIVYTYSKRNYKLSLFLNQDLLVNNAPDFQTGIAFNIPILK